jgi:hypothetical protein
LSQPLTTVAGAAAVTHLPEREMVVWAFPNDRKLHGLPALAAPGPLIDAAAKTAWGPDWRIDEAEHELVHYVAEHTCTLRVRVRLEEIGTGERRRATLYGKTYYNDEGAEAFENMGWLWNSDARRSGRLRIARPICYQPEARVLWQMGIEGAPLIEYESDRAAFPPLLEKAAGAIAALHRTDLPLARSRSLADRLESLRESQHRISIAAPALAGSVGRIVGRLVEQAPREANRPVVPLHGDLHLKNFFVAGSDVALIDLDNLHHGDPLAEIGSFLAGLYYRNLITEHPLAEAQQSTSRFIEAYRRRVEWAVPPRDLAWEIGVALILERASRCITRMKPGGFAILPSLIEAAGQFCQSGR